MFSYSKCDLAALVDEFYSANVNTYTEIVIRCLLVVRSILTVVDQTVVYSPHKHRIFVFCCK